MLIAIKMKFCHHMFYRNNEHKIYVSVFYKVKSVSDMKQRTQNNKPI